MTAKNQGKTQKAEQLHRERVLMKAAEDVGGYRSIELIAREAIRRLEILRGRSSVQNKETLNRIVLTGIELHGDQWVAARLAAVVIEYAAALRLRLAPLKARQWESVAEALQQVGSPEKRSSEHAK